MQICAKVGGEPWAVDSMPFTSVPTVVIGVDVYNKGNKSIVGCCASFNNTFTKYISIAKCEEKGKDLTEKVNECVKEAISQVILNNKIYSLTKPLKLIQLMLS